MFWVFIFSCNKTKETNEGSSSIVTLDENETILTMGPIVQCENPSQREAAPFVESSLGVDWDNQPPEGWDVEEGLWIGGEGLTVGDWNGDGLLDIYVPTIADNILYIQNPDGGFKDETELRMPNIRQGYSIGATTSDYDGDGDLDIFLLNDHIGHQLFQNDGTGLFLEKTTHSGLSFYPNAYYPSASWGDSDADGDLDLFVAATGGGPQGPPPWTDDGDFALSEKNSYWLNNGDGTFSSMNLPDTDPEPYSCCGAWIDLDGDQYQDLYVVNDFGEFVTPNQLYMGSSTGALTSIDFSDITIPAFGMGLAIGDINRDQSPDWFITDWGRNHLLLSDGDGGWYDGTLSANVIAQQEDQQVAWGAEFVDVNNDGRLDIWVGYGQLDIPQDEQFYFDELGLYNKRYQPDALYLQQTDGSFVDVASEWGINRSTISRGGVWADINQDGFVDFISPAIDGPVIAYLATCDDSNWINIRPKQTDNNRFAIGARIEVETVSGIQSRWVLAGGTSASSGGPPEAHFGLDTSESVTVRVFWADGEVSQHQNLDSRQFIEIRRTGLN